VGAPLLWLPFIELGHIGAALRNAYGLPTRYDGFSDPYFHAVALGNLLYGFLGLLVLDRLLRKWFPPWASFLAVTGVCLGSFLAFYLTYHAIYTHALTFLLIAVFVAGWGKEEKALRDYGALGLVLGIATWFAGRTRSSGFSRLRPPGGSAGVNGAGRVPAAALERRSSSGCSRS
jgi:hypothetical protein